MKYCPNCRAQLDDSAVFCPSCGTAMQGAAPMQTPYVDPTDHTAEFDPKDISDNKVVAMAAYLLGVVGVIIALLAASNSKYAGFHVRQSLKISICEIICLIAFIIPFLGWDRRRHRAPRSRGRQSDLLLPGLLRKGERTRYHLGLQVPQIIKRISLFAKCPKRHSASLFLRCGRNGDSDCIKKEAIGLPFLV